MKQIIISVLYLVIVFLVSQFIFEPSHLYYELWWLDIPMHIMGGFGVASLVVAVSEYYKKPVSLSKLFLVYAVVAITWEVYEYAHDVVTYTTWNGWFDTVKDFIDGTIGMYLAYLLIKHK